MQAATTPATPTTHSSETAPPGGVHPWSAQWCALLARVLAGRAATGLDHRGLPRSVAVVVLPSFTLVDPTLDLGRKGRGRDGARLRFPARVTWPAGADGRSDDTGDAPGGSLVVLVAAGKQLTLAWEARGVGVAASGSTLVRAGPATGAPAMPAPTTAVVARSGGRDPARGLGPVPAVLHVPSMARRRALSELDRIAEDGRLALWEARQVLERHAEWMLAHRHVAVALEIDPERELRLLDDTDLEVVRSELLLGDPERRISPAYDRIIERCLAPGAFARVDPERRVMTSLSSVAETALRRRIADPHVGRKVRQLLREETFSDLDALLAAYRARWPRDAIGVGRVAAAVQVMDTSAAVPSSHLELFPTAGAAIGRDASSDPEPER